MVLWMYIYARINGNEVSEHHPCADYGMRSLLEEDVNVIRRLFNRLDNELRFPGETDPTMESVFKRTKSTTTS